MDTMFGPGTVFRNDGAYLFTDSNIPVHEEDIQPLIDHLQETLNLYSWKIRYRLIDDSSMKRSLMKVLPTRDRQLATILIRRSLVGKPVKQLGPLLLHELVHLVLEPIVEEYEYQLEYEIGAERTAECEKRHLRCLEKTVEHFSIAIGQLIVTPYDIVSVQELIRRNKK